GRRAWLNLIERARPILLQDPRQGAVREQPAARLAGGTVIHLVFGVADTLHRRSVHGARLAEPAVHGHPVPERRHLLRERLAGFGTQARHPAGQGVPHGVEQPLALLGRDPAGETERSEERRVGKEWGSRW